MKPYFEDGDVTIYHGDAREVHAQGVACAVFSPPYNVGIGYDEHVDTMPWEDYEALAGDVARAVADSLAPTGRAWCNIAPVVQGEPGGAGRNGGPHSGRSLKQRHNIMQMWADALSAAELAPADVIAWCSQRGSGTAWGSYEMPSAPNVRGDWEALLWYFKGDFPRTPPAGMEGWRDKLGNWPALVSNVWTIRPEQRDEHPAPYPTELAARAIRLSTWPGETVLDPFMGSGTTLLAARSLGRKAVGVELSERYCEIAATRLAQGSFDLFSAPPPVEAAPKYAAAELSMGWALRQLEGP